MTVLRWLWRTVPGLWLSGLVFMVMTGLVPTFAMLSAPTDYSMQDTYYVVAHLHYMLTIFGIFGVFACVYHVFPRVCSFHYRPWLARAHFWTFFLGVNLLFLPQHFHGLQGMPRRYIDYPVGYGIWNRVSSFGYVVVLLSFLVFLAVVIEAFINRRKPGLAAGRSEDDVF